MPCSGDSSQFCGAGNRLQVYRQIAAPQPGNNVANVPLSKWGYTNGKVVRGVNLGGWFVIEVWMMPSLLSQQQLDAGAIDEWTIAQAYYDPNANLGGTPALRSFLEQHWSTWITEADFAQIKSYGLNTVRIPVGHWMFSPSTNEPYLGYAAIPTSVPNQYLSQALMWARKYGLDVLLDMHTAPGSVNGYDNGGRSGPIQFATVNATANKARLIDALVKMTQIYVNDPSYGGVVKSIELVNEPITYTGDISQDYLAQVYSDAMTAVRKAVTGTAPVMPVVTMHDGFQSLYSWDNYYDDSATYPQQTYIQDTHQYQAWAPLVNLTPDGHLKYACDYANTLNGINGRNVVVGEWSLATNCTNCSYDTMTDNIASQNSPYWNNFMRRFWEAQVIAYESTLGGWVFWSWKTETRGDWSYKDAVKQGWIPRDPTERAFVPGPNDQTCVGSQPSKSITFNTVTIPPPPPPANITTKTNKTTSSTTSNTSPLVVSGAKNTTSSSSSSIASSSKTSSAASSSSSKPATSTASSGARNITTGTNTTTSASRRMITKFAQRAIQELQARVPPKDGPLTPAPITGKLLNANAFPYIKKLAWADPNRGRGRMVV